MAEQTAHGICKTVALSSMMGYVPGFSYQSILNACVTTNPTCVFVNQDGVRFTSEDVDTIKTEDDIMFLVHYSKLVEGQGKVFSIVGSELMDLFRSKGMKFSTGFYGQPEMSLDEWDADEELARYLGENENLYSADTLEELAEKIGVPADAFVETIQTYDADCEAGTGDSAFGKDASWMVKVGEGPYYAFGLKSFLVNTNNGIRVNKDCQVCNPYYKPVNGLYAGGISISGFNDADLSHGPLPGRGRVQRQPLGPPTWWRTAWAAPWPTTGTATSSTPPTPSSPTRTASRSPRAR